MLWLEGSGSALESGSDAFDNTTVFDPEDNVTLSCAARSIQGPVQQPYPDTIVTTLRVYQSIMLLLASFIGMFLNVLLVILVAKYKKLQTLEFGLAAQVMVSGMMSSLVFFLAMLNSIANRWLFGVHMCGIVGATLATSFLLRTQALHIFVINRFFSVFLPYSYPKCQKTVVIILSLAAWLIATIIAITLYTLDCYAFLPDDGWTCNIDSDCSRNCTIIIATSITVIIAPSAIVPVFLYAMLFIKAKKAKNAITPVGVETKAYDWKATVTFFAMFLSTFALTLPNTIIAFTIGILYEDNPPFGVYLLYALAISLLSSFPAADAIVILRNRDVKEIFEQIKEKVAQKLRKK